MQCQTANMMQLEVTCQVASGKKTQLWKMRCFVPETQGSGFWHPHADVD